MYVCMYVCVCVCIYVNMYIGIYMCTYMYIYIHISKKRLLSPSIHSCIRTSCLCMLSFTAYIHAAGSLYPALSLSGSSLPLSPLSLPLSLSLALHTHAFIHSYIHSYTSILSCILTFTCKNVTSCTHTFKHGNLHTFFICAHSPFCFKLQKNSFFAETNKR